jgi:hypothetical protein
LKPKDEEISQAEPRMPALITGYICDHDSGESTMIFKHPKDYHRILKLLEEEMKKRGAR